MAVKPPAVDYSRKWLVMVAVALGILLSTVDASIVNLALPTLVVELDSTFQIVPWVVIAYLLTQAALSLTMGRLGDMLGKKTIYSVGIALFTAASVMCGFAPSIGWLIGFRVLQGIGAAMTLSLGLAILTEAFPPTERGRALGIGGSVVSLGIVLGPTIGGLIIDALSWRWIFFVNLPIGIIGTFAAIRFVHRQPPRGGQKFDPVGAVLLTVGLSALLLGMTLGQTHGFGSGSVLVLFGTAAALGWAFIRVERRIDHPMLDLSIFENRAFTTSLVTGLLVFVAIAGFFILVPFYLENVLGFSTKLAGLLLAISPSAIAVISPISGWLSDRVGSRPITIVGLSVLAVGYALLVLLDTETTAVGVVLAIAPLGVGMAIFQSPNNSVIMGSVRHERLGIASGMLSETRIVGQVTGIGLMTAVWAARTGTRALTMELPAAQAAAVGDVGLLGAGLMVVALGVAVWGLRGERRLAAAASA